MSHLDLIGSRKRKRGERVFRFKSFGEPGYPVEFIGPFRENVKALLEFGQLETNSSREISSWSFQLEFHRHHPVQILLFVVEEPVEASLNRHCNHCQYVGWGHHMICNKKYHFLLPTKDTVAAYLNCEGNSNNNRAGSANGKSNLLELQGHIMHGVFHSNGYGHLLSVNGVEMGSDLAGHHIMEFWDRLCTGLRARKVSLNDNSQKGGMELRLLHGLGYGEPWFGRWGYDFGRGTFCVTRSMYQKAIEAIQGMPLYLLIHHLGTSNHQIPIIFSRYQALSDHSLVTLGDLFNFMLELKSRLPTENSIDTYNSGITAETTCRWSPKRVEMATRVIVEALKRAEFRWVSRQEVRDAARAYIGDTGLLDFVLKSLGNHIVGNYLVRRSLNPVTKVLEYCLEDISNVLPNQEGSFMTSQRVKERYKISSLQLMKDIFYLYKCILKDQKPALGAGIFSAISVASRIILDSKYLIKEYSGDLPFKVELGFEGKLNIYCTVLLRSNEDVQDEGTEKAMPPYECVTLKNIATIDELKQEVQRNFREMYWGLRSLVVESVLNLNANGTDLVFGLVEVGRKLVFQGSTKEQGIMNRQIYECGLNSHVVDCPCGAKDEDGERMVSCDICEVWQHTRCVRIPNTVEIPHIFLCNRCEQEIVLLPSLP
ncbi:PHD finger protein MALE STERILITY 1 [Juglans microcarpa x Juglans regia]|uniref:PHD finger protein MALE STERILITY 1 n=1 Tax=Juglans microcarpa x Juglans regia TaxID=2249226 RepID=UPI001B7DB8F7|nr:PHD finger protein MALE STERILITY 1 [Juglans microcarpa x Juglans regia]